MSSRPQTSVPCLDSVVLDVERLGVGQASDSHRMLLSDGNQPPVSLEQLSPPPAEAAPRSPADIGIAVTSEAAHACLRGDGWEGRSK